MLYRILVTPEIRFSIDFICIAHRTFTHWIFTSDVFCSETRDSEIFCGMNQFGNFFRLFVLWVFQSDPNSIWKWALGSITLNWPVLIIKNLMIFSPAHRDDRIRVGNFVFLLQIAPFAFCNYSNYFFVLKVWLCFLHFTNVHQQSITTIPRSLICFFH